MALSGMRGLSVLISDIRNCQNKDQERLHVDKELGNIRTRIKNEKVRGVKPLPLMEMANLFNSFRLMVCPGLDPNPNNIVASMTFYLESTRAMLCLVRIETDPADRTQLRMTVASGDPTLTFELKEFIKEQLVDIPVMSVSPSVAPSQEPPRNPVLPSDNPGAILAGLL